MSSYSFSSQFYQHWTCAPEPVRAAITQELEDITTLLQTETPFDSFEFNIQDLDDHLDDLYDNHYAEQAIANAILEKQEQERLAAENQRLEAEQAKKAAAEAKLREQAEAAQKEQEKSEQKALEQDSIDKQKTSTAIEKIISDKDIIDSAEASMTATNAPEKQSDDSNNEANDEGSKEGSAEPENAAAKTIEEQVHTLSHNQIKDIHHNATDTINLVLADAELDASDQKLIRELEGQIDDYLSEQMMLMSENLKSWLRAEMTQHLSAQNKTAINSSDS